MSKLLKLKGKTQKGKNRCKEWGSHWVLLEERDHVASCNGPAFMVFSAMDTGANGNFPKSTRWIAKKDDPDFEIVEEELLDIPNSKT